MGWGRGSDLMEEIIPIVENLYVGSIGETEAFKQLIELFEDYDCDNLIELEGISEAFDDALKEVHPSWYEED
jgi:hypothetical protein